DYFNRFTPLTNVVTLPITNHQDNLVLGAVGCSSHAANNFADNALRQINQVLQQSILSSEQYQISQRQWLAATFPDFNMHYQQLILNFNSPTSVVPAIVQNPDKAER
ncbi:MAG: ABC transporter substrate-binding protein, partial [Pseudoalteromonas prydzensis]